MGPPPAPESPPGACAPPSKPSLPPGTGGVVSRPLGRNGSRSKPGSVSRLSEARDRTEAGAGPVLCSPGGVTSGWWSLVTKSERRVRAASRHRQPPPRSHSPIIIAQIQQQCRKPHRHSQGGRAGAGAGAGAGGGNQGRHGGRPRGLRRRRSPRRERAQEAGPPPPAPARARRGGPRLHASPSTSPPRRGRGSPWPGGPGPGGVLELGISAPGWLRAGSCPPPAPLPPK